MSALMVLLETLSIRYEKFGEDAEKKEEKAYFQGQREKLNMIGRFIYPIILISVMVSGYFVYTGAISLGPKGTDARHLVDFILDRESAQGRSDTKTDLSTGDGKVELTLSTWRPEDDAKIQILLDEFHKYAMDTLKRDITIKHEPVVSVNYDSILDIQLGDAKGPDLFYVRPFSVDGNIAKYLVPLNDKLALEENYDVTKRTPWTNRVGTYYAMPYVGVVQGVYYNQDLFDKYGIAVPQTWNEFLAAAKTISEKDPKVVPIANALNANEDSEMFMSIAANFLGGPDGRAKFMRTDGTSLCYTNSRVESSFRAISDLKPYLPKDAATMGSQTSKELFFNQQAVMLFGGSWDLQKVSDDADFNWGVFAVPAFTANQTYVIFQPDIGIGINKDSQHSEEALQFLEWMMTKDAVDLTAMNLVGFYPLNVNKPATSSGPNDQKFLDLVKKYPGDIRWMFTEISNEYPRADAIIRRDLNQMLALGLTPREAAQDLQAGLGEWYEPAQNCR
jgi:raffinose/stachyose/melibiose transport system substrate-binding protein